MIYCCRCGSQNLESALLCSSCGLSLLQNATAQAIHASTTLPVPSPDARLRAMYPHLEGVSGWLGFFVFTHLIGAPLVMLLIGTMPVTPDSVLQWALIGFGMYVSILILQRDPKALSLVWLLLGLRFLYVLLEAGLQLYLDEMIDPRVAKPVPFIVIWSLYFSMSKRVRLTLVTHPS